MHYRSYSGSSSGHAQFCVVAMMKSKAKASKKCSRPRCKNDAASPRAKFCTDCFKKNAALASSKRKLSRVNKVSPYQVAGPRRPRVNKGRSLASRRVVGGFFVLGQ